LRSLNGSFARNGATGKLSACNDKDTIRKWWLVYKGPDSQQAKRVQSKGNSREGFQECASNLGERQSNYSGCQTHRYRISSAPLSFLIMQSNNTVFIDLAIYQLHSHLRSYISK
jgi:hypothetical protein